MTNRDSVWGSTKDALHNKNARKFDGDNNFKKSLDIRTCVVGDDSGDPVFVFETKIPRSAVNELGMTSYWTTNSRDEAVEFLRQLADEIARGGGQ